MGQSNLHGLAAAGVSIWSDQISRTMLDSGELARRVQDDAVTGVTSNPTIFAGAITKGHAYDQELAELAGSGLSVDEICTELMATDIKAACDVLQGVWERTEGRDGYVSVEVSPLLASDTEATIEEARAWVKRIDRRNLFVKVPATSEGIPAIDRLLGEGIPINITLIFSLRRYGEVIDAYRNGVTRFAGAGGDPSTVASVASFFVSRVDTEVDRRLDELGTPEALALGGQAAVANARIAYEMFEEAFGAVLDQADEPRVQRPLWASTSTKNPAYPDTKYIDELVAPYTVNTMPLDTIDAYQDHGNPFPEAFGDQDIEDAHRLLAQLEDLGISYDDVVATLEREGVEKFAASWQQLMDDVERKVQSS
jgi:transaldolase